MSDTTSYPIEGGCDCRAVRYRVESAPLIVHCCHCRWCQRETGTAFALNAMIESDRITNLGAEPVSQRLPTESGLGQDAFRCPECGVGVWGHFGGAGPIIAFLRVGSLDNPDLLPPDVHIFTASKQPWVILPDDVPSFEAYYRRSAVWSPESIARYNALKPGIEAYRASRQDTG